MESKKVGEFIELAGQTAATEIDTRDLKMRKLGAGLVLSETLEYVIKGLGLKVRIAGVEVDDPQALEFEELAQPDVEEMLDGLADVAYTMYWNALMFGLPIEPAFEAVCDNNLEKFVALQGVDWAPGEVPKEGWSLGQDITWPLEVVTVTVVKLGERFFGVGKDSNGKVRKPSSFRPLDLGPLLSTAA